MPSLPVKDEVREEAPGLLGGEWRQFSTVPAELDPAKQANPERRLISHDGRVSRPDHLSLRRDRYLIVTWPSRGARMTLRAGRGWTGRPSAFPASRQPSPTPRARPSTSSTADWATEGPGSARSWPPSARARTALPARRCPWHGRSRSRCAWHSRSRGARLPGCSRRAACP
jgi:hypothetical protein